MLLCTANFLLLLLVALQHLGSFCAYTCRRGYVSRLYRFSATESFDAQVLDYPFVILPGFGNDMVDYINPMKRDSAFGLVNVLQSRGIKNVFVVPIRRTDWLNILWGIFKPDFWRGECRPLDLFRFYCNQVDVTVRHARMSTGNPVILVGHSAGGWLGRAILSDGFWMKDIDNNDHGNQTRSTELVAGLVSLGSPHYPPVANASDMTRGAIRHVDFHYPGAFLSGSIKKESTDRIFYVTVGGAAVLGNSTADRGSASKFAANSYLQVTGNSWNRGEEIGDGVVPLSASHLEGALQITIPEAWHSIQAPGDMWYGGDALIDKWLQPTLQCIDDYVSSKNRSFSQFVTMRSENVSQADIRNF